MSLCGLKEFPAFLHGQNELEFLELASNKIEGYVPNWISTLESLSYLSFPNNSLNAFEPSSFLSLPNLQHLDLCLNEFEGPLPIPPIAIVNNMVSMNKFSGEITPLFCNLTSVLALDLSNNTLSGNLPPCLGHLGDLASLIDLSNNNLSGKISDVFTDDCNLEQIDFSQNKLEGKVPRSLVNCSKPEILNLEENVINDVFPSWLGALPRLKVLSLISNKFHDEIRKPLSKFEFGELQIIDLSCNYFTGKLPLEYFRNWVAMKFVDDDHLSYMHSSTRCHAYFINSIHKGTEIRHLILEFSVFIDLSSNQFEGEIPEIIGNLSGLQSLNLSNNILTGQIPPSSANLTNLKALDCKQFVWRDPESTFAPCLPFDLQCLSQ